MNQSWLVHSVWLTSILFLCSKLNRFRTYIWILIKLFDLLHCSVTWLYSVYWFILLLCSVKSIKIQFIKLIWVFLKGQIVLKKILKSNSPPSCILANTVFNSSFEEISDPLLVFTFFSYYNCDSCNCNLIGSQLMVVVFE